MVGDNPQCVCFNSTDDSAGCFNSEPISPNMNVESCEGSSSSSSIMKNGKIVFSMLLMTIYYVMY